MDNPPEVEEPKVPVGTIVAISVAIHEEPSNGKTLKVLEVWPAEGDTSTGLLDLDGRKIVGFYTGNEFRHYMATQFLDSDPFDDGQSLPYYKVEFWADYGQWGTYDNPHQARYRKVSEKFLSDCLPFSEVDRQTTSSDPEVTK